jgi:hypothetical protein
MTVFTDLVDEVYIITNRPDLVNETKAAVRAATLKAHQSDFYPKDIDESGIQWANPDYHQSLEYRTLFPNWRALKFLRKYDSSGSVAGNFFSVLTPEQILDSYGIEKENICYMAGEMLEIKSNTVDTYMLLGYYKHPIVTESGYYSWVALENPYAIIYEAARVLFKQTGWDEQSSQFNQLVQEQFSILRNSNILAVGG